MKIHYPYQIPLALAALALTSGVQAACLPDNQEIGDVGPGGELICDSLEKEFPNANIQLNDRKLLSPKHVVVAAKIDGEPYTIDYRLVRADWVKYELPCLAGR